MTRPNILITAAFDEQQVLRLQEAHDVVQIEATSAGASLAEMNLSEELQAANVIIAELDMVDAATLALAPNLELVVSCRANPVNVDLEACTARGIPVATTPGRNAVVTADFSFALLLATVRKVSESERWLRSGAWSPEHTFEPYERFRSIGLAGRSLGIVGGGNVGRRVMKRALGFDMNVLVYDPFLKDGDLGTDAKVVDLHTLMRDSDVVSIHAPLTPETIGLIGAEELALMKPSAFLINAGRAAIIEEAPLLQMLREKRIAGAGFDVFHEEPVSTDSELFTLENVTLTPHIAGASDDVIGEHSRISAEIVSAWHAGEPIPFLANSAALGAVK